MTGDERIAAQIERLFALLIREGGRLGKEDEPGLTLRQGFALAAIADEGPQRLGALADRLGTTDATASRTVDALLALGLVERSEDPVDRRAVRIAASPAGRKLVAQRRRHLTQLLERPLAGIAQAEQAHIATVLADLNSLLA
jgi:DNA-binding MarR family transcriptional regulator